MENKDKNVDIEEIKTSSFIDNTVNIGIERILPLELIWQPKEDITTYELALCIPYINRQHGVMPYQINELEPHFRHFKIINHNKK